MSGDNADHETRFTEARDRFLTLAHMVGIVASQRARKLMSADRSSRGANTDADAASASATLITADMLLSQHSQRLNYVLNKLAELGYAADAADGFESLFVLLSAAHKTVELGIPSDEARTLARVETRQNMARAAQNERRRKASPEISRRRAEIENICVRKGWSLRKTKSFYEKLVVELGKAGVRASESAVRDDVAAILEWKK